MMTRSHSAIAMVGSFVLSCGMAWSQAPTAAQAKHDLDLVKDFQARVSHYLSVRKKEAGSAPKSTDSPAKLADTQQQMAQRAQEARSGARQGDIFTPEISDYFRRRIADTLAGPQGEKVRASLRHAEPLKGVQPKVNEKYPEGLPLQSTPPTLLLNLPTLPKELQYRIVGHSLVLHDVATNLIVDVIPNVLPQD